MNDKKLWPIFSLFIRLRDTNASGYGKCFTCPRIIYFKEGDCGHGVGRQHLGTKYNERNNHLQCKPCNGFEGGRQDRYKEEMNKRYGPNTWDFMVLASRKPSKLGKFEIKTMETYYQEQVKKLLKEKNIS